MQLEMDDQASSSVDILVLGAGWLSQFALPLFDKEGISYAATTRDGTSHYPSVPTSRPILPWSYDPEASPAQLEARFKSLPSARTVVFTFPIDKPGAAGKLVQAYTNAHSRRVGGGNVLFVQLGSTSVWQIDPSLQSKVFNRHSPLVSSNARGASETEFLALEIEGVSTTVLNLAGLWGGERSMRNWVDRVAKDKETLRGKGGLHMIHGEDVSRALVLVHRKPGSLPPADSPSSRRFILTDARCYDWLDLASWWASPDGPHRRWVQEIMREDGIVVIPRGADALGRVLDGREFWEVYEDVVTRRLE